eukprot:TRINITY_DN15129_c0_g2_i1.p1 TRINITY_DN15129_c0_g2~~TRINITY_DN15129_c0_g2_i1.p1  ORF type:complete len:780 (+),score=108.03 TRINITY_DN15129_c0_g2_i1:84-2423(+)
MLKIFKKKPGGKASQNTNGEAPGTLKPCKMVLESVRDLPQGGAFGVWLLRKGCEKEGKKELSVFVSKCGDQHTRKEPDDEKHIYNILAKEVRECLLHPAGLRDPAACSADALTKHKTLRHPYVLPYISGGLNSLNEVQIITEPCVPLRHRLDENLVTFDEFCMGVTSIANTLLWLHQCNLAYNNVTLDGIFITKNPTKWVLGDFAFCCPRDADDLLHHSMKYQNLVAPEDVFTYQDTDHSKRRRSCGKPQADLSYRDVYGLGCVIDTVLAKLGKASTLRAEVFSSVVEKADPGVEPSTPGVKSKSSCASFESQLENRGLEALLGEVSDAIEWIDKDSLPPSIPLVARLPQTVRALDTSEEMFLWAVAALHRSPVLRPNLLQLTEGRFISTNPLVRTVTFLTEASLGATPQEKQDGYQAVHDCFDTCDYSTISEVLVPLLCNRSTFLDQEGDEVYRRVLLPKKPHEATTSNNNNNLDSTVMSSLNGTVRSEDMKGFEIGSRVQAFGLKRTSELNGQVGVVAGIDPCEGRILVTFDSCERAIRPGNLLSPQTTGGVLLPLDYQLIVVPFLKQALQDKLDNPMRVALLKRAKYFLGTFDHGGLLADVLSSLQDEKQRVGLRAAACSAVPSLVRSSNNVPQKAASSLLTSLHKIVQNKSAPSELRTPATASLILSWGHLAPGFAVSALTSGLHDPTLSLGTLDAISEVLRSDGIPQEEIAGTVVPLLSPLLLSPDAEVRRHTQQALNSAFSVLAQTTGNRSFPPPRPLPTASSLLATLPRAAR